MGVEVKGRGSAGVGEGEVRGFAGKIGEVVGFKSFTKG